MIETTLTLADGRSLGMAEWGPPDAPVVVFCRGFPGSRLEPNLWHGAADHWVPISTASWLADRIPDSPLTGWPDHGHFSWAGTDEAADVVAVTAGQPTGPNR